MIHVEITNENGEQTAIDDVADTLCVGDTVRWADHTGTPGSVDGGRIDAAVGDTPFRVGLRNPATGKKRVVHGVSVMRYDPDDKLLYLTGGGWVDRQVAEVVRVRSELI